MMSPAHDRGQKISDNVGARQPGERIRTTQNPMAMTHNDPQPTKSSPS
jgi:hypothetical protein